MKKPTLTNRRKGWAAARGGAEFKGRALIMPDAVASQFDRKLRILVEAMIKDAENNVRRLMKKPEAEETFAMDASFSSMFEALTRKLRKKFDKVFRMKGLGMAETLAKGVSDASRSSLHASLREASGGLSLGTSVMSGRAKEAMQAGIKNNVALIKSIPSEYLEHIEGIVYRAMQAGAGQADIVPQIEKLGHSTRKRAELIARDQTSKATTSLNVARMRDLGITKFEWVHSGGGKEPRELHLELDGQVFDIDNPPVIDKRTQERGFPAQLINCRCRMAPVISFVAEAVEE